jgi:hypothetical protein
MSICLLSVLPFTVFWTISLSFTFTFFQWPISSSDSWGFHLPYVQMIIWTLLQFIIFHLNVWVFIHFISLTVFKLFELNFSSGMFSCQFSKWLGVFQLISGTYFSSVFSAARRSESFYLERHIDPLRSHLRRRNFHRRVSRRSSERTDVDGSGSISRFLKHSPIICPIMYVTM